MSIAVEIKDFSKSYKKIQAVDDISLSIQTGEIYGLIGPDGAGKSTLMQAVAGVLRFNSGQIRVFDQLIDSDKSAEKIKHSLGFMPQGLGLNLYPDLSIEENIDFFANLRGVSSETLQQRKKMLLEVSNLNKFKDRAMKNLSGGMKQKLGLVCTLIHQPRFVILDEPTTGVDPVSRRDFWEMLNQLVREENMTALISTAYMDEATRFNRLTVMHKGKVLDSGTADEIIERTPGWLIEIESKNPKELLPKILSHFPQAEEFGQMIRITGFDIAVEKAQKIIESLIDGKKDRWYFVPIGLEDVFIHRLNHVLDQPETVTQMDLNQGLTPLMSTSELSEELIKAEQLVRRFDKFTAVDKVSFNVSSGEIFGLLGANGAGKSTVIKMLTGILPPSEGSGFVAGHDMATSSMAIKESIGYMSQAFSLYLDLTVNENIDLFGRIYGLSGRRLKERSHWVLAMGHLENVQNTTVGSLPMGKRQRLALGCALVHEPRVLFLDEPTSGVDPIGRREFWQILVELAKNTGVAILVTTHYMQEAEHCHKLALMQAGKVVAYDSPKQLKRDLKERRGSVLSFKVSNPYTSLSLLQKSGYSKVALFGSRVQLFSQTVTNTRKTVSEMFVNNNIEIENIMVLEPTLEDVFVDKIESAIK
ncbi:ATP-binding cassette domain-containing protein [Thiomicrorhabdus sp. Milos-T2]|uniref:ATP-binding cassette domain-containing protein n=1 Tax=Thiomicrorhabdus sp. Milos-T2 TaxID=90814 RepID=UPI000494C61E|nr:ATP-binding cassette domain-containing protein [Thiomicrorhabdus sp. Milos-T2]